jgi:hypothetical protein
VTKHAYRATDGQVQTLREEGWTGPRIAEAVYVAALFNLFVRIADAFDIHPPELMNPDGAPATVHSPRSNEQVAHGALRGGMPESRQRCRLFRGRRPSVETADAVLPVAGSRNPFAVLALDRLSDPGGG